MTGFGRTTFKTKSISYTIEIKSVNSKNLDLNFRIPSILKEREAEIRGMMAKGLERGKIDFSLSTSALSDNSDAQLNKPAIEAYLKEIKGLSKSLKVESPSDLLGLVLKMPNSLRAESVEIDPKEWSKVSKSINACIKKLKDFRKSEGKAMAVDLSKRLDSLETLLGKVAKKEKMRSKRISEKLKKKIAELKLRTSVDQNRFEQEMIYYLEKIDITEERVRFKAHCAYFRKTMSSKDANGKKLGFIAQEMGREINTIGAKANDVDLQQIVVEMKNELEKIKEQLFNVL